MDGDDDILSSTSLSNATRRQDAIRTPSTDNEDSYWNENEICYMNFDDDDTVGFKRENLAETKRKNTRPLTSNEFSSISSYHPNTKVASENLPSTSRAVHSHSDESADIPVVDWYGTVVSKNTAKDSQIHKVSHDYIITPEPKPTSKHRLELNSTPAEIIQSLLRGKSYRLEHIRNRLDKQILLKEAVSTGDGNTILMVVLFLKSTLKKSIFQEEILKVFPSDNKKDKNVPVAALQYINYLRDIGATSELIDWLSLLNRDEDAALVHYTQAVSSSASSANSQISSLDRCFKSHYAIPHNASMQFDRELILQQIELLRVQSTVEEHDSKVRDGTGGCPEVWETFQRIPYTSSLIRQSVLNTLYYGALYHYDPELDNFLGSPLALKKSHNLSEKEYQITVLRALARDHRWPQIKAFLTTKGKLFSRDKLRASFSFATVVRIMANNDCLQTDLMPYFEQIDDQELRFELAKKFNFPSIAIQALVTLKDRRQLEMYAAKLLPNTPEDFLAQAKLKDNSIKWKYV